MPGMESSRFVTRGPANGSVEKFTPTTRVSSYLGLLVVVGGIALTLSDGHSVAHWAVIAGWLFLATTLVLVNLRPAVYARADSVLVRNALTDVEVPWRLITLVEVRHLLEIVAGDRVVKALAFSRTTRQQRRYERTAGVTVRRSMDQPLTGREMTEGVDYTDYVAQRLRDLVRKHCGGQAGEPASEGLRVVTRWRWAEVAVLVVLAVMMVVLIVIARS